MITEILNSDEQARVQAIADHYGMTFDVAVKMLMVAGMKVAEDTAHLNDLICAGKTQIHTDFEARR
jgi:hypothetical protein